MGRKLFEIMADGLYAVFHRFEAFLKKMVDAQAVTIGCPSNGRRASSISALPAPAAQTSVSGTACSLLPAVGSDSSDPPAVSSHGRNCLLVMRKKRILPLLAGTHHGGRLTCGPTKRTCTQGFVNIINKLF